jgi:hypothetical protein
VILLSPTAGMEAAGYVNQFFKLLFIWGFHIDNHVISKQISFHCVLPELCAFFSLFHLLVLERTASVTLKGLVRGGLPCLVPDHIDFFNWARGQIGRCLCPAF